MDLCGPMSTTSKSGNSYSMNIIDNFSSYVWSLPLKKKSDAAHAFQQWQLKVENLSGNRLEILVSDNGELLSQSMQDWCSKHGIDHQLTAPHTSTQNASTAPSSAKPMQCALLVTPPYPSGMNSTLLPHYSPTSPALPPSTGKPPLNAGSGDLPPSPTSGK